jgi:hypothetical protein
MLHEYLTKVSENHREYGMHHHSQNGILEMVAQTNERFLPYMKATHEHEVLFLRAHGLFSRIRSDYNTRFNFSLAKLEVGW